MLSTHLWLDLPSGLFLSVFLPITYTHYALLRICFCIGLRALLSCLGREDRRKVLEPYIHYLHQSNKLCPF
jgi:hypothetical protein